LRDKEAGMKRSRFSEEQIIGILKEASVRQSALVLSLTLSVPL